MRRVTVVTAGMTSATLGVAAGHLLAALLNRAASPVVAVGAVVVDRVPPWLKEFAVRVFGFADKAVLLTVVAIGVAVLAGLAGLLGARSRVGALVAMAVLGLVGTAAGVSRAASVTISGAGPFVLAEAALPGLTATVIACLTLAAQLRVLGRVADGPVPADGARPVVESERQRRAFLLGSLGVLAGAGVLGWFASLVRPVVGSHVTLPPVGAPQPPLPAGLEAQVPGLTPLRTPLADFFRIDTALVVPRPDPTDWRLTVDGMVANPYELTMEELLEMGLVERDITLTCVSNPVGGDLCGSTRWTGVLVAELIRHAVPEPGADMVLSRSTDGFTASTPLEALLDGRDAMIALAMDGLPLTAVHGAPARLLTPGLYGYVGATKWLTRLTVTTFAADQAYWTQRGWSARAPVKTAARIDTPSGRVAPGRVTIAGVAWATHRGIGKVEVRVDDGPWQAAVLGPDVGPDYWRQWYLPWQAGPGRHRLVARAYDAAGVVQTEQLAGVVPDGATGYPEVVVTIQ